MSDVNLGEILEKDSEIYRDAIHIAIAPIIAGEDLFPGTHVAVVGEKAFSSGTPIGVVDPFLWKKVMKDERFYLLLYPKTITNLRHEWIHPAFPINHPKTTQQGINPHEEWIRNWAEEISVGYQDLINSAHSYIDSDEYMVRGGLLEGVNVKEGFWEHFEKLTGKSLGNKEEHFFSCSC